MPTCQSCRGEYTREECVCPVCGRALQESAKVCHQCSADTRGQRLCPRCKSDVSAWEKEKEEFTLQQFLFKGGFFGLLPSLVAIVLAFVFWIAVWSQRQNSIHHPIGSILGIIISLVIFFILFSWRYSLRERAWASEIYHVRGPSLSFIDVSSLLVGTALLVVVFTLYKLWQPPTHFSQKLIFAVVYSLTYASFTVPLTLLPLGSCLTKLNERVPQPIFVHTDRLVDIVLQTAAKSLKDTRVYEENTGKDLTSQQASREEVKDFEVIGLNRKPADGSIQVSVKEHESAKPDSDPASGARKIDRVWVIDADKWGRIRSLKPTNAGEWLRTNN